MDSAHEESKRPLMSVDLELTSSTERHKCISNRRTVFILLLGGLLGVAISQTVLLSFRTRWNEQTCTRLLSGYSPALSALEYTEYEWQNDFDHQDVYRGKPTVEKDAAWAALWEMGDIVIKLSELPLMNKSDDHSRRLYRPELGGIAANLEAFHQLHCLDMIRRYTYRNEYNNETIPADIRHVGETDLRDHVDHCITTLRLAIMCTGDVTPILMERDPDNVMNVFPDMRTPHKCRRFDKIQEWFREKSYTDWDCIQRGGVGCDIIPSQFRRPGGKMSKVPSR
ncbi:hypothetical protein DCS_04944 [Drechmeria coniospora]|uniref:Tat pathway signal sequence n=1 Tax=Drechmeria coniospora TaxID=98403 RepID=A0A151GLM6_DRECN|nr:hypothetical protein DCS_04944 [Drechmeria coniospora]KYK57931.1 hypothetical protein DCS_04944 [Drechmeria coniospora]